MYTQLVSFQTTERNETLAALIALKIKALTFALVSCNPTGRRVQAAGSALRRLEKLLDEAMDRLL